MSGGMRLDRKDRLLLSLLYANSRMSFTEMGRKMRLSSSAVERRMRRLEDAGVICLLFANVDLTKLGLKSYRLYFKFDVMDRNTESGILKLFEEYPQTLWGVICEGEYDALWRIVAKSELDVEDAAYLMLRRFGGRVVERTVATTTYQIYLAWNRALETPRHPPLPTERIAGVERVDGTDMKILSALYSNAREKTITLSRLAGLTPDAVQYRIRRLIERKIILGYTAWFDAKKLGFNYYKIMIGFRSATKEDEKKFLRFCMENDAVIFINKTIGSWDMEVDIIVRNNEELHEFMRVMRTEFGHILGKHLFVSAIEERMLNPLRGAQGGIKQL